MKDLLYLSLRHAAHHRMRTVILVLSFAVVFYLPIVVQIVTARYEESLTRRAASTPLVLGAKGNRFDLTLNALYFRSSEFDPVEFRVYESLRDEAEGLAIPMHVRSSTRNRPIVATSLEYFDVRGLAPESGTLPLRVGDVVIGAAAAAALGVSTGDTLFSDQRTTFDIAESPSLELRVTGVLAASGTPDDEAVFADIRSAWLLEGLLHGHAEAREADPRAMIAETEEGVVLNSAIRELASVDASNMSSFHLHGDPGDLPLSSVLLFPASEKDGTIVKARVNAGSTHQMLVPGEVIDDLLAFVFRVKGFIDLVAALLAVAVVCMTVLVMLLTVRLRAREMRTLHSIGCGRFTVVGLYATELAMILVCSGAMALAGVAVTLALLPDLVTTV